MRGGVEGRSKLLKKFIQFVEDRFGNIKQFDRQVHFKKKGRLVGDIQTKSQSLAQSVISLVQICKVRLSNKIVTNILISLNVVLGKGM